MTTSESSISFNRLKQMTRRYSSLPSSNTASDLKTKLRRFTPVASLRLFSLKGMSFLRRDDQSTPASTPVTSCLHKGDSDDEAGNDHIDELAGQVEDLSPRARQPFGISNEEEQDKPKARSLMSRFCPRPCW